MCNLAIWCVSFYAYLVGSYTSTHLFEDETRAAAAARKGVP